MEGGHRDPLIVRWPGVIKAGSTCDTTVCGIDFYPTMLAMSGAADLPGHASDGVDLVPLLKQTGAIQREALYWHFPHVGPVNYSNSGGVRMGDWMLVEQYRTGKLLLFNLRTDLRQKDDLAQEQPERVKAMHQKLVDWRKSLGIALNSEQSGGPPSRRAKGAGAEEAAGE
jgi:arylsulfatase A-like enzyme